jgi:hypothetical protein
MIGVWLCAAAALAQDGSDDLGFGDAPSGATETKKSSPFSLGGYLRTQEALWVERLGTQPLALARQTGEITGRLSYKDLRAVATLHGEVDPYYLVTDQWDPATTKAYGWLIQPRELWIGGSTGPVDVTAGRQVVTWGEGVLVSPLDRINARDSRDPGITELGDLRLPVTMLRAGVGAKGHRLEAIVVPEGDWGLRPPPEGPFGLVPGIVDAAETAQMIDKEQELAELDTSWGDLQPRFGLSVIQAYGRYSYRGRGVDLSLYGANLLDKQGVIANPELADELLLLTELEIPIDHVRYTMLGHSGTVVGGPFSVRWEVAVDLGREFNLGEILSVAGASADFNAITDERTLITPMLGFGWTGLPDFRLDVEVSKAFMPGGVTNLTLPVAEAQYAARVSQLAFRQRLEVAGLFVGLGTTLNLGWVGSLQASYELADGVHASLGYITMHPGADRGPLIGMTEHDRAFTSVRWDF